MNEVENVKYEDKTALINEIYDILRKPEHEYLFIRMMAELIARYVMIARREKEDADVWRALR